MKSRSFAHASFAARKSSWRGLGKSLVLIGFPVAAMGACSSEPDQPDINGTNGPVTGSVGGATGTTDSAGAMSTTQGSTSSATGSPTTTTAGPSTTTGTNTTGSSTTSPTTTSTDTTGSTGAGGSSSAVTTESTTTQGTGGNDGSTSGTPTTTGGVDTGPTLEDVVGSLDGMVIYTPCGDQPSADDCAGGGWYTNDGASHACEGNALDANVYHDIGGDPGVEYMVSFHFYGIAEPKNYGNGLTRDAGNGRPDLNGSTPYAWASAPGGHSYPGSNYNTYEIRVEDENMQEVAVYYLNSDTQEGHYTMIVDYEKTIGIIGGGRVHVKVFDANCRQIKNCGASGGYPCSGKARSVDGLDSVQPALPGHFDPPALGVSNDHAGQWIVVDALELQQ